MDFMFLYLLVVMFLSYGTGLWAGLNWYQPEDPMDGWEKLKSAVLEDDKP